MKTLSKEIKYKHSKSSFDRHPSLQSKMRAMLLDWLMEVLSHDLLFTLDSLYNVSLYRLT